MSFPAAYQDPCAVPTFRARSGFRKSFAPRVGVLILGIAIAMLQASQPAANATVLVATNSVWAYRKGTSEASIPIDAWRRSDFNDSAWPRGRGPFYYDSGGVYSGNTELPDMRNQYTCVYLRTSFAGGGAPAPSAVRLRYFCDDGFALWINGLLVTNVNKSTGSFAFGSVAAAAVGEPLIWKELRIPNPADWWNAGANQIAVQAFNSSLSSSDFVMELELATEEPDTLPPRIVRVDPPPGAIGALTSVTVEFSEPVVGLGFSDLLVNDRPAVGIEGTGTTYRFAIEQPAYGEVRIGWDQGALIEDLAAPPNRLNPQGLGTGWTYQLVDSAAPTIVETSPPPGITVRSLRQIEVRFSEIVTGVDAADLLIDETPAVSVTGTGNGPYVFRFEGIPAGEVSVEWSETSGIRDLGEPPHPLPATKWSYTVDPAFAHPAIRISEVLAGTSGTAGLRDEDGETHDWIELENRGTVEANLEGWSLSDDPADPGKWVFPAVRLAPGRFVVVFASGKNRRPANTGTPLHTNFRLATRGEFLGLFTPETPRELAAGFEPAFPEQRNDYSYGSDGAGGMGYFERPTPGSANGSGSLTGLLPRVVFDVEPGWFDQAFTVHLACAVDGAVIRYTTDGSVPTIATGAAYTGGIEVQRTQVLRAAAFLAGWVASPTATRTYLFPADVIRQPANPPEVPAEWVDTSGRSWTADYGMDPEIVDSPAYRDRVLTSLRSLPAMSIVTRPSDMFDNARGIYPKSQARGPSWEREASVEILELDGGGSVQVDCGVQMQGNSVRDPVKTAKHAFRLVFKGDYGEPKLRYRVFPDSRLDEFDTLTLRADFNNSWMHWNGAQRPRGQRVRDAWIKDSQRAMGGLASHSRFFHLYVNGLYWGVYDATERPDAAFAAAYQGGAKEEYDVVNEGQLVDGSMAEYNTMRSLSGLDSPAGYERMKQSLDVTAYIDYLLLHFYVGHEDWFTDKNWYASRRRGVPGAGFRYQSWDGELMMNSPTANIVTRTDQPSGLHTRLLASPEYRLEFADRAQRHCFGSGALTPAANAARYQTRLDQVEPAMVAESARWGDYRRDVHRYSSAPYELYTPDIHFQAEKQRLLTTYFPARTATLISQLKAAGLYPANAVAPAFSLAPGRIERGARLVLSAPSGTVFFTTDGSDPRIAYSGGVSPRAAPYTTPLVLQVPTVVKARTRLGNEWSALSEGVFEMGPLSPTLAISEIHYHPLGGGPYEFVEVWNYGDIALEVAGYSFSGISFVFPAGSTLVPGQRIVLASGIDPAAFNARHPGLSVSGWFDGTLADGGEWLALLDRAGHPVVAVDYNDRGGWPGLADGSGPSIELLDPWGDPNAPANWRASLVNDGSPGNPTSSVEPPPVRLNEIVAVNDASDLDTNSNSNPEFDWVELHNSSDQAVDLAGWSLTDDSDPRKAVFPPGTVLGARDYLWVACRGDTDTDPTGSPPALPGAGTAPLTASFALDRRGETVSLHDRAGHRVDAVTYGVQIPGFSFGRVGTGLEWSLGSPTPGEANVPVALATHAAVRINEWQSNPPPGEPDWLEFHNLDTTRPASIQGFQFTMNAEPSRVGTHSFIEPGGFLVLEADGRGGPARLGFKLPASGGSLRMHDPAGHLLDQIGLPAQAEAESTGRLPDGADGPLVAFVRPTPGRANGSTVLTPPVLDRIAWDGAVLRFRVRADPGAEYAIENSGDLRTWKTVWSGRPTTATFESTVVAEDPAAGFFRVRASP